MNEPTAGPAWPVAAAASRGRRVRLIRDFHSGAQLDLFLVAAVASVLLIRFYLVATGYPQIGSGTLHIAHMLWGGLLMMVALILLLAYLGRAVRLWGALLGGVGFGTFIDEIGKFVTRDNDYFYRPTFALMYVVFVAAYLAMRAIRRRRACTTEEYVVNALHELEEAAMHDLQRDEQARAMRYLAEVRPPTPLSEGLAALIASTPNAPARTPARLARAGEWLLRRYQEVAARPAFWRGLIVFFVVQLAVKLLHVVLLVSGSDAGASLAGRLTVFGGGSGAYDMAEWLQLGSSLISAAFVAAGIVALRTSRSAALRHLERSVLVSVFVTQVFMFYHAQLAAVAVLGFNLLVLLGLGYMRAHHAEGVNVAGGGGYKRR